MCFLLIGSMLQFKSKLEAGHTCYLREVSPRKDYS
jgi:hypothetical protein